VAKIDHIVFKFRIYLAVFGMLDLKAGDVATHTGCRLGKWYYEGEGQACFSKLPGYREIEPPTSACTPPASPPSKPTPPATGRPAAPPGRDGERLDAGARQPQKMGETAVSDRPLLCNEHAHTH
jgi:hypothetical protein